MGNGQSVPEQAGDVIIEIHKSDDGHTWRYIDIVSKAVLYTIRIEKAARTSMTGKKKSKFTAYRGEASGAPYATINEADRTIEISDGVYPAVSTTDPDFMRRATGHVTCVSPASDAYGKQCRRRVFKSGEQKYKINDTQPALLLLPADKHEEEGFMPIACWDRAEVGDPKDRILRLRLPVKCVAASTSSPNAALASMIGGKPTILLDHGILAEIVWNNNVNRDLKAAEMVNMAGSAVGAAAT